MSLFNGLFSGLLRVSSLVNDPFRVIEVDASDYCGYEPMFRDDCIVLYKAGEKEMLKFDIVFQTDINYSTHKAYSLYRTTSDVDAQVTFCQMRDKLPLLVNCFQELGTSKSSLQEISQVIRDHPSWTATHIAAHFGCLRNSYIEMIRTSPLIKQINEACEGTQETPLHVAAKAQQLSSITTLMNLDVRMDIVDVNGNSVLHYAAKTNKEVIQTLTVSSVIAIINLKNNNGCTALHLACMADKPDCVMELLRAGADVNIVCESTAAAEDVDMRDEEQPGRSVKDVIDSRPNQLYTYDIKNGGTPLHWAKTPELMEALIEFGCNVDAKDFQGNSALHVMVQRLRLACAVTLLSHQANVDARGKDGNTALHFAVKSGEITFTHLLVAFGADVNLVNDKGETPRHIVVTEKKASSGEILYALHVVGAVRCPKGMYSCSEGCSISGQFNGIPPDKTYITEKNELFRDLLDEVTKTKSYLSHVPSDCDVVGSGDALKRCRVLSLDGGGIRGLVLIQLLYELEKVIEVPIIQCFDWVVGTSTGGVLALVLASGKSIRDTRCLYFQLKDKVFVGSRPYDSEALEAILKKELGSTSVMTDIIHPRVMLTATKGDRKPAELHCFRNYPSPLNILGHEEVDDLRNGTAVPMPDEQLVWKAARATGAAPTYFRASGSYLDGGLIANNPTLDAITEIHQCNKALLAMGLEDEVRNISCLVSLGTGKCPVVPVDTIDVFRPDSFWGVCKMALGVTALGQLLVDQATQTDGRVTARAHSISDMLHIPYFRLNPQLSENVALDETSNKILAKILWETTAYMHSIKEELLVIATLLRP